MARTVKEEEYAVKRKEIVDVTQRLVYTKGYEHMSIQDILNELRISKGAFYHYFESKNDLLEALVDQMLIEAEPVVRPIVDDPNLTALEKLHRLFDASARWKSARKDYILSLVRVWYADENAIVRQKIQTNSIRWTTPLIEKIIQQGVREGVFNTAFSAQTGELVMYLLYHIGDAMVEMIFSSESKDIELVHAEKMMAASNEALERVLGAPAGSLNLVDRENLKVWFEK
jgi:AcrR family transcriptional regulator